MTSILKAGPHATAEQVVVEDGERYLKLGTILEGPDCWMLVYGGFAESMDDECRDKVASMNPKGQGLHRQAVQRMQEDLADFQQDQLDQAAEESDECDDDDDDEDD